MTGTGWLLTMPTSNFTGGPGCREAARGRFSAACRRAGLERDLLVRRRPPLGVLRVDAADEVDVRGRDPLRHRPHLALAEREAVDGQDRRDLVAAAAEERLLGDVELGAVDAALDDVHAEHLGA